MRLVKLIVPRFVASKVSGSREPGGKKKSITKHSGQFFRKKDFAMFLLARIARKRPRSSGKRFHSFPSGLTMAQVSCGAGHPPCSKDHDRPKGARVKWPNEDTMPMEIIRKYAEK